MKRVTLSNGEPAWEQTITVYLTDEERGKLQKWSDEFNVPFDNLFHICFHEGFVRMTQDSDSSATPT